MSRLDEPLDDDADLEGHDDPDDEEPLLTCPSCRQSVHEDTQQCPNCGDWIVPVDPAPRWRAGVWTAAALLAAAAMVLATVL
ncbi:MAG: hypothetical protein HY763_02490 [Planctomycetes bacterium]|nr:hypothetical protein [Planctomycetota bacterium]